MRWIKMLALAALALLVLSSVAYAGTALQGDKADGQRPAQCQGLGAQNGATGNCANAQNAGAGCPNAQGTAQAQSGAATQCPGAGNAAGNGCGGGCGGGGSTATSW